MPLVDPISRKAYIAEWKRLARRKRGLQKQGRKEYTPEQKAFAKLMHKAWAKVYYKKYSERNLVSYLYTAAKRRAKDREQEFNIDKSDIIIPELCPYLGIPFQLVDRKRENQKRAAWPTLDRIDNRHGYIKGNIQVISHQANTMKSNASIEELITFAESVLRLHKNEMLDTRCGNRDLQQGEPI